jgi:pimeloyl-ACP methyl ester carboxylesterase
MRLIDVGRGVPIVLVPGIQGRWEWMRPAVEALASRFRVLTFSLADEPACDAAFDESDGFDCYVRQVGDALDQAKVERAFICGVSYGGLVAAAFAARHPERTLGLILVSALPPGWKPDARVRFYLRAPRLLAPLFMAASLRLYPEIAAANDGAVAGMAAGVRHAANVLTHMFSPARMARRVRLLERAELGGSLETLSIPTLVITGEAGLDRVVPVRLTEDYMRIWPHARRVTLMRTGHLGSITRPGAFLDAVLPFVESSAGDQDRSGRRKVG